MIEINEFDLALFGGVGFGVRLALVLGAFRVEVGANVAQGVGGVVFIEAEGGVDRFERGDHRLTDFFGENGAAGAFESMNGCVAVEGDDEAVAIALCLEEDLKVSGVEEVEAAIDEDNALSVLSGALGDINGGLKSGGEGERHGIAL